MQLKFIESFLLLYQELNISKTSNKLFITQQGLSRQIQSLEKEFGILLFERTKNGLIPTEICRRLHPHMQQICNDYKQIYSELENYCPQPKKSVSVAFAYGLSNAVSTDFIFEYQQTHTDVDIEIYDWSKQLCIEKLASNDIDIAFLVNPFDTQAFSSFPLAEDYMFAAMHKDHPLAGSCEPIPFAKLDGEKLITGSQQNSLRQLFDYFCELEHITPRIIVSSSFSLNFVNAMTENRGIATVTTAMAEKISNPDIRIRRLITPQPGYMYCCTARNVKLNEDANRLLKYIKQYFQQTALPKYSDNHQLL